MLGETLSQLAQRTGNLVVLTSDISVPGLSISDAAFFNLGLSIEDLVGTAAGLSIGGKLPIVIAPAALLTSRGLDQIRNLICLQNLNVKLIGIGAGFFSGQDGAAFHALEDIAAMRALPLMKIFCSSDMIELRSLLNTVLCDFGPAYIRMGMLGRSSLHEANYEFVIGKGEILFEGNAACIITYGSLVRNCVRATEQLREGGIRARLVALPTIKPLDEALIKECSNTFQKIFVIEEHQVSGGLGSAIAELLSESEKGKLYMLGMRDHFTESASPSQLYRAYGLDSEGIYRFVRERLGNAS